MQPRILVVDDDLESARALARLLELDGFEVVVLDRPTHAIELLATERFDGVVTDLDMPGMDGFSLLEAARVAQPDARLVLASGNMSIDPARLRGIGFVPKPLDYDALLEVLPRPTVLAMGAATAPATPLTPRELAEAFAAAPVPLLVVAADTPRFTIVAANDAYLAATVSPRDALVGRPMFDAFPDNPADPAATGVRNLGASFERVLATRGGDPMPVQRYDIPRRGAVVTEFEERHWTPCNAPVLRDGAVARIVHRVDDVTTLVRARVRPVSPPPVAQP